MLSRFPVSFWLSKFWTRSSKFHFRALTGKRAAASGKWSIMLCVYRFLPRCRYVFGRSANNAPKSMILWQFTTKRYQKSSRHHHTISARPTDSANGRGHQKWPKSGSPPKCHQSANPPNGHLGNHKKAIDLVKDHQIWTSPFRNLQKTLQKKNLKGFRKNL